MIRSLLLHFQISARIPGRTEIRSKRFSSHESFLFKRLSPGDWRNPMGTRPWGPHGMQSLRGLNTILLSPWQRVWCLLLDNVYPQHPAQHQAHNTLSIDDFQILFFLLCLVTDILPREGLSLFSLLFISWFIFYWYELMDSYFIQWVMIC